MAAPQELSGGNFIPLHVTASAGRVMHFVRNWRTPTENIGTIIRIVYAWTQSNAGVSFSVFESPDTKIPYLRGRVIPAIRSFLCDIGATIVLDNTFVQPKLRTNDICIMDVAIKMCFTKNQLERLNAVREWYNVMWISELCTQDGLSLRQGVKFGYEKSGNLYTKIKRAQTKQTKHLQLEILAESII